MARVKSLAVLNQTSRRALSQNSLLFVEKSLFSERVSLLILNREMLKKWLQDRF